MSRTNVYDIGGDMREIAKGRWFTAQEMERRVGLSTSRVSLVLNTLYADGWMLTDVIMAKGCVKMWKFLEDLPEKKPPGT